MSPEDPEDRQAPEPDGVLGALFTPNRFSVPVCSWVPGRARGERVKPDALGIQHASGTKTVARLRELGVPVPDDWRCSQDHPRRGLVVMVPAGSDLFVMFGWLVRAAEALCSVELTGRWRGTVA